MKIQYRGEEYFQYFNELKEEIGDVRKRISNIDDEMSKAFGSAQEDQNQISDDLKKVEVEIHNIRTEYKEKVDAILSFQKYNAPAI